MPTKFNWVFENAPSKAPLDPTAVARRVAREAAEAHLNALLWPWQAAAHARSKQHAGAEQHWLGCTCLPLAARIESTIVNCQGSCSSANVAAEPAQNDAERQRLAEEILEELQRPDSGLIRGGGAATAAAVDHSKVIHAFLTDYLITTTNEK